MTIIKKCDSKKNERFLKNDRKNLILCITENTAFYNRHTSKEATQLNYSTPKNVVLKNDLQKLESKKSDSKSHPQKVVVYKSVRLFRLIRVGFGLLSFLSYLLISMGYCLIVIS